jgi:hypothetical protein
VLYKCGRGGSRPGMPSSGAVEPYSAFRRLDASALFAKIAAAPRSVAVERFAGTDQLCALTKGAPPGLPSEAG